MVLEATPPITISPIIVNAVVIFTFISSLVKTFTASNPRE